MKMMKSFIAIIMMMLFAQLSFANTAIVDNKMQKVSEKLTQTQTALGITSEQQGAWNAYKDAVMNRAQTMADAKMKMRVACEGTTTPAPKVKGQPKQCVNTAMDRLNQKIAFSKTNTDSLEKMKPALEGLYKVLTPAQQKTADQTLKIK